MWGLHLAIVIAFIITIVATLETGYKEAYRYKPTCKPKLNNKIWVGWGLAVILAGYLLHLLFSRGMF